MPKILEINLHIMKNKEFGKQLENRTKQFAIRIILLSSSISYKPENNIIRIQLTKSGTSIGANYRESNRARSKADFVNKLRICESEASETVYWLEIIKELNIVNSENLFLVYEEAKEILAIFTSIGYKLRINNNPF